MEVRLRGKKIHGEKIAETSGTKFGWRKLNPEVTNELDGG